MMAGRLPLPALPGPDPFCVGNIYLVVQSPSSQDNHRQSLMPLSPPQPTATPQNLRW